MVKPLKPEELTYHCDESIFSFKTTNDVEPSTDIIGQERALRSIEFGLGVEDGGYNIYVLGEGGTGKSTTLEAILNEKATGETVPDDWCYVFDFDNPDRPKAISLPPGKGIELRDDLYELIEALIRDIPKVFESKDYESHRDELLDAQQERTKALFERIERLSEERDFVLKKTASGLSVVPGKDGKAFGKDEYDNLPKRKKSKIEEDTKYLQDKLGDAIREARKMDKETKERIISLDREVVQYVVTPLMKDLLKKYDAFDSVKSYITELHNDILSNIDDFRKSEDIPLPIPGLKLPKQEPSFERYEVNLFVNNTELEGAPVVIESNPTYSNLFGHVEHKVQYGIATTDFTMIKSGSIHRANGGYLIVNAIDLLRNLFVYDALKRMIRTGEARIEDVWEQYRPTSTPMLKPSPVPVKIKLILIGEPRLYYLLYNLDNEYRKYFKVKADFDDVMPRTEDKLNEYATFIATRVRDKNLLPFDRSGVGKVIEYGIRMAGDKDKLSVRFGIIEDLIVEASYWAKSDSSKVVKGKHVDKADNERIYRASKIEDKLREYIINDTVMISTEGNVVGQINGLAVLDPGDYAFGKPSRVTAKTFMGDAGVVNIEREVKMSGRIHNKAHMILKNFLGERFAKDFPLTFSASVTFEQLYEGVEGDSATCTEVYALLSSLSDAPIKQGIAVTGSMNQLGEVQPIGGVNVKIEGFFDVCEAKGLTGEQGVIIPKRNVRNLMLKENVVNAVRDGKFNIYPIEYIDEGLEILTGLDAGERGKDGSFPKGSINAVAEAKLHAFAKKYKAFGRQKSSVKDKSKSEDNSNNDMPEDEKKK